MMEWMLRIMGSWTKIITANEKMWNDISDALSTTGKVSSDDVLTAWAKVVLTTAGEINSYVPIPPGPGLVVLTSAPTDFPVVAPLDGGGNPATKVVGTMFSVDDSGATVKLNKVAVTGDIDATLGSATATVGAAPAAGTYSGVLFGADSASTPLGPIAFAVYVK